MDDRVVCSDNSFRCLPMPIYRDNIQSLIRPATAAADDDGNDDDSSNAASRTAASQAQRRFSTTEFVHAPQPDGSFFLSPVQERRCIAWIAPAGSDASLQDAQAASVASASEVWLMVVHSGTFIVVLRVMQLTSIHHPNGCNASAQPMYIQNSVQRGQHYSRSANNTTASYCIWRFVSMCFISRSLIVADAHLQAHLTITGCRTCCVLLLICCTPGQAVVYTRGWKRPVCPQPGSARSWQTRIRARRACALLPGRNDGLVTVRPAVRTRVRPHGCTLVYAVRHGAPQSHSGCRSCARSDGAMQRLVRLPFE